MKTIRSLLDANEFRPMTEDEKGTFGVLSETESPLGDMGAIPAPHLDRAIRQIYGDALADSFNVAVMTKRLAAMAPTQNFSPFTLLFLAMSSDRVGVAVMWTFAMFDYHRRNGKVLTLARFAKTFANGMPTEHAMEVLWEEQKQTSDQGFGDNQIDSREAWTV